MLESQTFGINMNKMKTYKAIIIGATGAVGSEMVQILLSHNNCEQLTTITRKPMPQHPKLRNIVWEDFSNFLLKNESSTINVFRDVDVVFCCLGASRNDAMKLFIHPKKYIPKFQLVDKQYVLKTAMIAKDAGVSHFSVISAMLASSKSKFVFSKIKGETEEMLKEIELTGLSIFRPAQLLQHNGPAWEKALLGVFKVFNSCLPKKYKGIWVEDIAKAMIVEYEQRRINKIKGSIVIESDIMQDFAKN